MESEPGANEGEGVEPADAGQGAAVAPETSPGELLRGDSVAPGLVLGVAHLKDYDLTRVRALRVPRDEVDRELNRFRTSLEDSRLQLVDLKSRLEGRVDPEDARVLDTHVTYLKDSVFIADVENLILNEQMRLEAAITKVINDFDRIFRLVSNETLRQSAVDLRDVAIRVLRNLEKRESGAEGDGEPEEYVLVARELSIVDMFNLANERVQGIATEGGGLTSHAAILARSMGIPTITNVAGLLETVKEGDFLILDATEGVLRVNPGEIVRQQYAKAGEEDEPAASDEPPEWAQVETRTRDGEELAFSAACGNLPEVEQAASLGMGSVGLYRTELLFLMEGDTPSRDALVRHYESVVSKSRGPVTFRLLNVDSNLEIPYLHKSREPNPHFGRAGVRLLLSRDSLLRRQLQAIMIASRGADVRIAIPLVTDCGELRRVKEILFEERIELRKTGQPFQERVELGCVVETPAAMIGIRDLAREADFLTINLDSLVQYLLAADRESAELSHYFESLHPMVLRSLTKISQVSGELRTPLSVFGVTAAEPRNLPFLVGAGLRDLAVPPASLRALLVALSQLDLSSAARATRAAARSSSQAETESLLQGFRHGFARS